MQQYLHHLDPEAALIITRVRRPGHARPTRRTGIVPWLLAQVATLARLPRQVNTTPASAAR